MIHLFVDVTGGDFSPGAQVAGACDALALWSDIHLTLAGPAQAVEQALLGRQIDASRLTILDCPETITNHDEPTRAIRRKPDSAIVKGMAAVKSGECQGFISTGSTGAVLAAGTLLLGRMPGVARPALGPSLPTLAGTPALLIDCGANVDSKAFHLQQFAVMGTAYMQTMYGISSPRVGLLNIGAEEGKGNALCKEAQPLLAAMPINFIGNIEARDILSGDVDVIVTDAFAGNIALKGIEGAVQSLFALLKGKMTQNLRSKIGAKILLPAFRSLKDEMDVEKHGGAPLLGVAGCVVKGHGNTKADGVCAMIGQSRQFVAQGMREQLDRGLHEAGIFWQRGDSRA